MRLKKFLKCVLKCNNCSCTVCFQKPENATLFWMRHPSWANVTLLMRFDLWSQDPFQLLWRERREKRQNSQHFNNNIQIQRWKSDSIIFHEYSDVVVSTTATKTSKMCIIIEIIFYFCWPTTHTQTHNLNMHVWCRWSFPFWFFWSDYRFGGYGFSFKMHFTSHHKAIRLMHLLFFGWQIFFFSL